MEGILRELLVVRSNTRTMKSALNSIVRDDNKSTKLRLQYCIFSPRNVFKV